MINELDTENRDGNSATYCPEDNKIRIYIHYPDKDQPERTERDTFLYLRECGYKSTPKQSCNFVATWSMKSLAAAVALIADGDDLGDEDVSPEERAIQRAERFEMYRDKRRTEAHDHADTYDAGPNAIGHQDQSKADKEAKKRDRTAERAYSQWSKAEYWQSRTVGVISHSLHRGSAHVRRGRILDIEKRLRKVKASYTVTDTDEITQGFRGGPECVQVWVGKGNGAHWYPKHLIEDQKDRCSVVVNHLEMRLLYENAMLENEGGKIADVDMIPGGFIFDKQIQTVNKSKETGRVVSVKFVGDNFSANIERLGSDGYRPPTPEVLEEFKAAKKKLNDAKPKLLNPTLEDAKKLQQFWNSQQTKQGRRGEVREMTQAEYTFSNKQTDCYGSHTVTRDGKDLIYRPSIAKEAGNLACKVRVQSGIIGASSVVCITDKPQKPLPLDWSTLEAVETETPEEVTA